MNLANTIDHTILKPNATRNEVEKICKEAVLYGFASVCVNQYYTSFVTEQLMNSDVKVCTVVGFPLGAVSSEVKAFETQLAVQEGAQEIDMVINIGALKDKDDAYVLKDIEAVVKASGAAIVKVIIETCLLSEEEKVRACELAVKAGADFVKTSTGFSSGGATVEDIKLMRKTVGHHAQVKASGGIRDYEGAVAVIEAGADRIGASAGIAIVENQKSQSGGY